MFNNNIVVNFHRIDDVKWFENTILYLKKKYRIVPISEVEDFFYNNKMLINTCHFTIDDGDKSVYYEIYPVIRKLNIPISIYVSPKSILERQNFWFQDISNFDTNKLKSSIAEYFKIDMKKLLPFNINNIFTCLKLSDIQLITERFKHDNHISEIECRSLTADQLKEMHSSKLVTVGAHTQNHPILFNESNEVAEYEISASINNLSKILGEKIRYFVYPNGRFNIDFSIREINLLKKMGIRLSFSTMVNSYSSKVNPYSIPRIGFSFGSDQYVKRKILYSKYYELLLKFQPNSALAQRNKIKKIIKTLY